jgi:hypothetical protein
LWHQSWLLEVALIPLIVVQAHQLIVVLMSIGVLVVAEKK